MGTLFGNPDDEKKKGRSSKVDPRMGIAARDATELQPRLAGRNDFGPQVEDIIGGAFMTPFYERLPEKWRERAGQAIGGVQTAMGPGLGSALFGWLAREAGPIDLVDVATTGGGAALIGYGGKRVLARQALKDATEFGVTLRRPGRSIFPGPRAEGLISGGQPQVADALSDAYGQLHPYNRSAYTGARTDMPSYDPTPMSPAEISRNKRGYLDYMASIDEAELMGRARQPGARSAVEIDEVNKELRRRGLEPPSLTPEELIDEHFDLLTKRNNAISEDHANRLQADLDALYSKHPTLRPDDNPLEPNIFSPDEAAIDDAFRRDNPVGTEFRIGNEIYDVNKLSPGEIDDILKNKTRDDWADKDTYDALIERRSELTTPDDDRTVIKLGGKMFDPDNEISDAFNVIDDFSEAEVHAFRNIQKEYDTGQMGFQEYIDALDELGIKDLAGKNAIRDAATRSATPEQFLDDVYNEFADPAARYTNDQAMIDAFMNDIPTSSKDPVFNELVDAPLGGTRLGRALDRGVIDEAEYGRLYEQWLAAILGNTNLR